MEQIGLLKIIKNRLHLCCLIPLVYAKGFRKSLSSRWLIEIWLTFFSLLCMFMKIPAVCTKYKQTINVVSRCFAFANFWFEFRYSNVFPKSNSKTKTQQNVLEAEKMADRFQLWKVVFRSATVGSLNEILVTTNIYYVTNHDVSSSVQICKIIWSCSYYFVNLLD